MAVIVVPGPNLGVKASSGGGLVKLPYHIRDAFYSTFRHPGNLSGSGYLAGEFPGGITTVDGVPASATVRILYRPAAGALGDGMVVAEVQSAPDGTWRVDGLNPALKYDVVGRKSGHNDVILASVTPATD